MKRKETLYSEAAVQEVVSDWISNPTMAEAWWKWEIEGRAMQDYGGPDLDIVESLFRKIFTAFTPT